MTQPAIDRVLVGLARHGEQEHEPVLVKRERRPSPKVPARPIASYDRAMTGW